MAYVGYPPEYRLRLVFAPGVGGRLSQPPPRECLLGSQPRHGVAELVQCLVEPPVEEIDHGSAE